MQKNSIYLSDLKYRAETICLFIRFGVICRKFLSKKKLG